VHWRRERQREDSGRVSTSIGCLPVHNSSARSRMVAMMRMRTARPTVHRGSGRGGLVFSEHGQAEARLTRQPATSLRAAPPPAGFSFQISITRFRSLESETDADAASVRAARAAWRAACGAHRVRVTHRAAADPVVHTGSAPEQHRPASSASSHSSRPVGARAYNEAPARTHISLTSAHVTRLSTD
jgi:hypothetical protein